MKIGLISKFSDNYVTSLKSKLPDHEIILLDQKADSIFDDVADIDIFIGANASDKLIESAHNLKLFHVPYVGLDRINFPALQKKNVILCNSKWNDEIVAEFALTLLLTHLKQIVPIHNDFIKGSWKYRPTPSRLLFGSKVLLIGFGSIGQELAKMLQPFTKHVIALRNNPEKSTPTERELVQKVIGWDTYLEEVKNIDYIIVSLPLTPQTEGILSKEHLKAIKKGAILVNVGRGKTIDEEGLYEVLKSKHLGGAAIDTWYNYISSSDSEPFYPSRFPFQELDNIIMSPHRAATFSTATIDNLQEDIVFNVTSFASKKPLRNVINYDKRY